MSLLSRLLWYDRAQFKRFLVLMVNTRGIGFLVGFLHGYLGFCASEHQTQQMFCPSPSASSTGSTGSSELLSRDERERNWPLLADGVGQNSLKGIIVRTWKIKFWRCFGHYAYVVSQNVVHEQNIPQIIVVWEFPQAQSFLPNRELGELDKIMATPMRPENETIFF